MGSGGVRGWGNIDRTRHIACRGQPHPQSVATKGGRGTAIQRPDSSQRQASSTGVARSCAVDSAPSVSLQRDDGAADGGGGSDAAGGADDVDEAHGDDGAAEDDEEEDEEREGSSAARGPKMWAQVGCSRTHSKKARISVQKRVGSACGDVDVIRSSLASFQTRWRAMVAAPPKCASGLGPNCSDTAQREAMGR